MKKNKLFKYEVNECPICMDTIRDSEKSITTPCMHVFCIMCIGKWLNESSSSLCPICKQEVTNIIYSIMSCARYKTIRFPKAFSCAWDLHKKTKVVINDYEGTLYKLYNKIRCTSSDWIASEALEYLKYSGDMNVVLVYRDSVNLITEDKKYLFPIENCVEILTEFMVKRLRMFFSVGYTTSVVTYMVKYNPSFPTLITEHINRIFDPDRAKIIAAELEYYMCKEYNIDCKLMFYVKGSSGDSKHMIMEDCKVLNVNVLSGILISMMMAFKVDFENFNIALTRIDEISKIFNKIDRYLTCKFHICDILEYLGYSLNFILNSLNFYKAKILKTVSRNINKSEKTTKTICNLVQHCLNFEDLEMVVTAQYLFKKQYIFIDFTDDESSSVISIEEEEDESTTICLSDDENDIILTGEYMEILDSDDDDIQIVSVELPTEHTESEPLIDQISAFDIEQLNNLDNNPVNSFLPKIECIIRKRSIDSDNENDCSTSNKVVKLTSNEPIINETPSTSYDLGNDNIENCLQSNINNTLISIIESLDNNLNETVD